MHYLSEDTARRRVKGAAEGNSPEETKAEPEYNDEGKDVYNKMRVVKGRLLVEGLKNLPRHPQQAW